jgi:hypothetical protein
MRYPASEKLEIIRIVEQSHLSAKRTLDQLGIARRTFYRWYDRFSKAAGGAGRSAIGAEPVWNRIPPASRTRSSRWRWNSLSYHRANWRCDSPMNALLRVRSHGLPPAQGPRPDHQPGLCRDQGRRSFHTKTTRPNEMWQTDFTYFKIIGWGWMYCRPCSTTSRATSSPGSCAPTCEPRT